MYYDVFLSHSWKDKPFVRQLADDLLAAGYNPWLDERELRVGDQIATAVSDGITKCRSFAIVLSGASVRSPWVTREVNAALVRETKNPQSSVLPILVEDCELPALLDGVLYADFRQRGDYSKALSRLIAALGAPLTAGAPISDDAARLVGTWIGGWQGSSARREVTFRVVNEGAHLAGSMTISYLRNGGANVVEETGPVNVAGTQFRMDSNGYRWMVRTSGREWRLDHFQGGVVDGGAALTGMLSDDHGRRSQFFFSRGSTEDPRGSKVSSSR